MGTPQQPEGQWKALDLTPDRKLDAIDVELALMVHFIKEMNQSAVRFTPKSMQKLIKEYSYSFWANQRLTNAQRRIALAIIASDNPPRSLSCILHLVSRKRRRVTRAR